MTKIKDLPVGENPWVTHDRVHAFDNPWLTVFDEPVTQPNGAPGRYGRVHFKNWAVGVLPVDAQGRVPLVGQWRYPLGRYSWELPEGGGARNVDPLDTAKRELKEETGLLAASWRPLCGFDVSNSVTDEEAICFFATDLTQSDMAPDETEVLEVQWVAFADLLDGVISGHIRDSLTIVMTWMGAHLARSGALDAGLSQAMLGGE
ncbi:MAG: NUDIX domain-containing protein [Maricaulaceae bacterium]